MPLAAVLVTAVLVTAVLGRDCVSYAIKKNSSHPFLKHNGENTIPPRKANARNAWQKRGKIEKQEKQRHEAAARQWIVQWQLSRRENLSRAAPETDEEAERKKYSSNFYNDVLGNGLFLLRSKVEHHSDKESSTRALDANYAMYDMVAYVELKNDRYTSG